jgi:hypothetical protein
MRSHVRRSIFGYFAVPGWFSSRLCKRFVNACLKIADEFYGCFEAWGECPARPCGPPRCKHGWRLWAEHLRVFYHMRWDAHQDVRCTLCNHYRRLLIWYHEMSDRHEVDGLSSQVDHFGVSVVIVLRNVFGCSNKWWDRWFARLWKHSVNVCLKIVDGYFDRFEAWGG